MSREMEVPLTLLLPYRHHDPIYICVCVSVECVLRDSILSHFFCDQVPC